MFEKLSDQALKEAYENAVLLELDIDFILLLEKEINHRGIKTNQLTTHRNPTNA
ncbi:sporulation histidine kinase inhibitor Sda [Salinibacillus xinjiangensis]|uniref:Sporulation histidine kinase inhibitor Sda n=1 Tax=Salinibacillus xinjiangensis TaxID=1229268 RepID=A0A6G1X7E3_9BACI|nr:sporulation histidine kinase inhibitor Sda [Salinibacillus xinjiangensis]MRG86884.1 sporulation histidine kinase inhibitor Sda [Salinibacillus xinjiangensis]